MQSLAFPVSLSQDTTMHQQSYLDWTLEPSDITMDFSMPWQTIDDVPLLQDSVNKRKGSDSRGLSRRSVDDAPAEPEDSKNLVWSVEMEVVFLESVQRVIDRGLTKTGFKTSIWKEIVTDLIQVTPESLQELLNANRVKRKYFALRNNWLMWTNLLKLPGWSLDESTGCPVADSDTMKQYFKANPYAKKFQTRPLRYQEQLNKIFSGTVSAEKPGQLLSPEEQTIPMMDSSDDEEDSTSTESIKDDRSQFKKARKLSDQAVLQLVGVWKEANALQEKPSAVEKASRLFFEKDFGFDAQTKCVALDYLSNENMAEIWYQAPDDMKRVMIQRWSSQSVLIGGI